MDERKRQQYLERVDSKIHYGEDPEDVREWLAEETSLSPEEVEEMIASATKKRTGELRAHAVLKIGLAIFGIIFSAALLISAYNLIKYQAQASKRPLLLAIAGCLLLSISIVGLFHAVRNLVTGNHRGAVRK